VGRHAAGEGSADPIVTAALASRPGSAGGAHSVGSAPTAEEAPVGWPAPPVPGGGRVGWPADGDAEGAARATVAEPELRGGWRRFFRARRAA
jgi:hypothetical protein